MKPMLWAIHGLLLPALAAGGEATWMNTGSGGCFRGQTKYLDLDREEFDQANYMKCIDTCYREVEFAPSPLDRQEVLLRPKERSCPYVTRSGMDMPCENLRLKCSEKNDVFPNACSGAMPFNQHLGLAVYAYRHELENGETKAVLATRLKGHRFRGSQPVCRGEFNVSEGLCLGVGVNEVPSSSPAQAPPRPPFVSSVGHLPEVSPKDKLLAANAEVGTASWQSFSGAGGCSFKLMEYMNSDSDEVSEAAHMKCIHLCYKEVQFVVWPSSKMVDLQPQERSCPYVKRTGFGDIPCEAIRLTCSENTDIFPNACSGSVPFYERIGFGVYAYRQAVGNEETKAVLATRLKGHKFRRTYPVCSAELAVKEDVLLGVSVDEQASASPVLPVPRPPRVRSFGYLPEIDPAETSTKVQPEKGTATWGNFQGEGACTFEGAAGLQETGDSDERSEAAHMKCIHLCYKEVQFVVWPSSKLVDLRSSEHSCPYVRSSSGFGNIPCGTIRLTCSENTDTFPNACSGDVPFYSRIGFGVYAYHEEVGDGETKAVLMTRLIGHEYHHLQRMCSGEMQVTEHLLLGVGVDEQPGSKPLLPVPDPPRLNNRYNFPEVGPTVTATTTTESTQTQTTLTTMTSTSLTATATSVTMTATSSTVTSLTLTSQTMTTTAPAAAAAPAAGMSLREILALVVAVGALVLLAVMFFRRSAHANRPEQTVDVELTTRSA